MKTTGWEHYCHVADIGVRGYGPTMEAAFAQAALALTAVICDLERIEPKEEITIECDAENDLALLFASWLNAVIYEMATRNMLFSRFEVGIGQQGLHARAWGEKLDVEKHRPVVEVKAATYCDLKVQQNDQRNWVVQCIVDV